MFVLPVAILGLYPRVAEQGYLTYTLIVILAYSIIGFYYNMLLGNVGIPFLGPMVPYAEERDSHVAEEGTPPDTSP